MHNILRCRQYLTDPELYNLINRTPGIVKVVQDHIFGQFTYFFDFTKECVYQFLYMTSKQITTQQVEVQLTHVTSMSQFINETQALPRLNSAYQEALKLNRSQTKESLNRV